MEAWPIGKQGEVSGSRPKLPTTAAPQAEAYDFIYSSHEAGDLYATDLDTGLVKSYHIPSFNFRNSCSWCEVPGKILYFTGGGWSDKVDSLDLSRELAVCSQPSMLTVRDSHASLYYEQCIYVLGGVLGRLALGECERYVLAERRWEELPALPIAGYCSSPIVVEQALYLLGGIGEVIDLIQKLNIRRLVWDVMQIKLPECGYSIPCFKISSEARQVHFIVSQTLYTFHPSTETIHKVKRVARPIESWSGPSYYKNGTLYCSGQDCPPHALVIGELG
jgi:hypothetical protein